MIEDSNAKLDSAVSLEQARRIISLFDLAGPFEVSDFAGKGNINRQTYLIVAGSGADRKEYILQLLNPAVFTQPHAVMDAMVSCIQAQRQALSEGLLRDNEEWETIQLIPTKEGRAYLEVPDEGGPRCWRIMGRIRCAATYKSLREITDRGTRLRVAEEAARGLSIFGTLTAGMDPSRIGSPLPGYRNTRLYYDQLLSVLAGNRTPREAAAYLPADRTLRQSTEQYFLIHLQPQEYRHRLEDPELGRFISLSLEQRQFALALHKGLLAGNLKKVIVHGDTKLDNFLFSTATGKVKALVDLDTIMPHTWLTDWGDMARSLSNVAGERERDLEKIEVDLEVFIAMVRGYLTSARHVDLREVALMVDAAQIMALELGVRFLADHLRGDNYFKLGPADRRGLNKTRAMVQFCVFESLRRNAGLLKRYVEELAGKWL